MTFTSGTLTVLPLSLAATGSTIAAVEGFAFSGVVATFKSPDSTARPELYTATILWGDGQVSAGVVGFDTAQGVYTVKGIHTYQFEGVYAVQVDIGSGGTTLATANGIAAVSDAPLTVAGNVFSPTASEAYAGAVATFTDANPLSRLADLSVTIDWGDGSMSYGTIVPNDAGGYLALGTHTYAGAGVFTIRITALDQGGSQASAKVDVQVVAPPTTGGNGTSGGSSTGDGSNPILVIGGPAASPPPLSFVLVGGSGVVAGSTVSAQGGASVIPLPGVRGPGPVVVLAGASGSSSGPVGEGSAGSAATGNAESAGATGKGPTPGVLQAAVELALETLSRQLDALLGTLSNAGVSPTIRGATANPNGVETRMAAGNLPPLSSYLWGLLDDFDKQVTSGKTEQQIAEVLGTGVAAYVGYVLLNSRGGYVLLSLLTAKPLWAQVDPLAILLDWERDQKRKTRSLDDEETLQPLIEGSQGQERDEGNTDDAPERGAYELDRQSPVRRSRGRALSRPRSRRAQRAKGPL